VTSEGPVRIERIELEEFRVFRELALDVPDDGLRIVGPNGAGKSSLLESIELLSTTRPRRGSLDADLINHASGAELGVPPYTRVIGQVTRANAALKLEIFIQRVERRNATKKLIRVHDRPRRAGDVVGLVPSVSFSPDDMALIDGPPSVRRRFLDILLSQVDRRYLRSLSRYARILAQRNSLLRSLAAEPSPHGELDQLAYWDDELVGLGAYVVASRALASARLAARASGVFRRMSARSGQLVVRYVSTIQRSDEWWDAIVAESKDVIDAAQRIGVVFEQQLRAGRRADMARGATLVGPHRDDVRLAADEFEIARFGSRGQQRLVVLALKLAEIDIVADAVRVKPVLLLDDVLSELDAEHRTALLVEARALAGQCFVTSTDRSLLDRDELNGLDYLSLVAPGQPD
jgi:DNA replication and repair protein RecF